MCVLARSSLEASWPRWRPKARVLVIDSIQTLCRTKPIPARLGGPGRSARQLTRAAKAGSCAVILVSHVTKEEARSPARRAGTHRRHGAVLRGRHAQQRPAGARDQNRFGSVSRIGVFAMTEHGLRASQPGDLPLGHQGRPVQRLRGHSRARSRCWRSRPWWTAVAGQPAPAQRRHRTATGWQCYRVVLHRHAGVAWTRTFHQRRRRRAHRRAGGRPGGAAHDPAACAAGAAARVFASAIVGRLARVRPRRADRSGCARRP